jgi:hypothetical protein
MINCEIILPPSNLFARNEKAFDLRIECAVILVCPKISRKFLGKETVVGQFEIK